MQAMPWHGWGGDQWAHSTGNATQRETQEVRVTQPRAPTYK